MPKVELYNLPVINHAIYFIAGHVYIVYVVYAVYVVYVVHVVYVVYVVYVVCST